MSYHTPLDEATQAPLPPHEQRRRAKWSGGCWRLVLLVPLVLILLVGATLGTAYYLFEQQFAGRIYPNISVRGVPVGNLTAADATDALTAHHADYLAHPITITYDQLTWTPTAAELGARLELEQAVQAAMQVGRSHPELLDNLRTVAAVWQHGLELPLHLTVDQPTMQAYVVARAAEIERPAVDAQFALQNSVPVAVPAIAGRQALLNDTVYETLVAMQQMQPATVTLRTRELLPYLSDGSVAEAQREVDRLLSEPITLVGDYGQTWTWSTERIAQLLQVQRVRRSDDTGDELVITQDYGPIAGWLEEIATASIYGGSLPRVAWNGGNLVITQQGAPRWKVDTLAAEALIVASLEANERTIQLPYTQFPPAINESNLAELGITTLLSVGRSDFTGSEAYRVTNIIAGMRLLDGVLIPPGSEFSFNQTVAAITPENGFVEGYVILNNRTQKEWGGGICQDSTTVFRAAFWAGLPFTERWGHSFYIDWYDRYGFGSYGDGPGMDATIFMGGPDLRFVNDTGGWLLMQTGVDTSSGLAEVYLYGSPNGRTVELIGPTIADRKPAPNEPVYVANTELAPGERRQSDVARGGMTISFGRVIRTNGVEIRRDNFSTTFKPWPNIYEVHPAEVPATNPFEIAGGVE
ncbi:MAG: vanomycin resistance protein VanB [Chloroflexaceae bacterium]|nr:vanomycin resistance protein VanB [Chloroflexaceae bacterium]